MDRLEQLRLRQESLKRQIAENLDLLIGTVNKTPAQAGYYLTAKVEGKSVTRYVRKHLVGRARLMTRRHNKVRALLRRLSAVNWDILNRSED